MLLLPGPVEDRAAELDALLVPVLVDDRAQDTGLRVTFSRRHQLGHASRADDRVVVEQPHVVCAPLQGEPNAEVVAAGVAEVLAAAEHDDCLLYTSPSPRD